MATIVISAYEVANYPEGGGHFWVYMQYVLGLQQLGCDVYWLEGLRSQEDVSREKSRVAQFKARMANFGLGGKVILYRARGTPGGMEGPLEYIETSPREADSVFREADLLLNFHYAIDPAIMALFRRTALIDIDPGLLQLWIATGQLEVPQHDVYLTTGETVGTADAKFPDCGKNWLRIRPPVCLERWPFTFDPNCKAFTTVSNWWGIDWVKDADGNLFDNNKRVSFVEFLDLPKRTAQPLELALCLGDDPHHQRDRVTLERIGWRIRHAFDACGSPASYQSYIQKSRGEFSCAKPSCMKFQGAWVSDRTLCYLASGKPVVVQHSGPSSILPNGKGMFRFKTMEDAVGAFETINADYDRHCRAAREIAQTHFDSKRVAETILNLALHMPWCDEHDLVPNPVGGQVVLRFETDEH